MPEIKTLQDFWPYYLAQHRSPVSRGLHYVGSTLAVLALGTFFATMNPWWLLATPLAGYSFAWIGHFGVEKNRPATFGHPIYSLVSDYRMYFYAVTGKLDAELAKLPPIATPTPQAAQA